MKARFGGDTSDDDDVQAALVYLRDTRFECIVVFVHVLFFGYQQFPPPASAFHLLVGKRDEAQIHRHAPSNRGIRGEHTRKTKNSFNYFCFQGTDILVVFGWMSSSYHKGRGHG